MQVLAIFDEWDISTGRIKNDADWKFQDVAGIV